MKFLKGVLVFFLLFIIVGGLGFIGYTTLFTNHSGHNAGTIAANTEQSNQSTDTSMNAMQNHSGMTQNSSGSQHSNMTQNSANSQQPDNSVGLNQANIILQNKDSLSKSISALNEAIKLMTVDPYASTLNSNDMGNMQMQSSTQASAQPAPKGNVQAGTSITPVQGGNNTTINIYPQGETSPSSESSASQQNNMTMQNMGTAYDANKMEQLHNGLYKMSLGMALLNQLQNQLENQAQSASANTNDLVQYYTNQYNLAIQNKSKLTEAQNLVNEASSLININPYVSSNGLVYDKERMNNIHQSVYKLAEGVASLNLLGDDFTRQSIVLSNTLQTNIANASQASQMNHAAMSQGLFGGLFDNVSVQTVFNLLLIIFVMGLVLSIFGFIFSQLKPTKKDEVI